MANIHCTPGTAKKAGLGRCHMGGHTALQNRVPMETKVQSSVSDTFPKSKTRKYSRTSRRNLLDGDRFPKDLLKAAQFEQDFEGHMDYT